MIRFRDNAQAINTNQADAAAFGLIAVAGLDHRALLASSMSPRKSGKRRRPSTRTYSGSTWSGQPTAGVPGVVPSVGTGVERCRPLHAAEAGPHAAALWAALVIQRALST